MQVERVARDSDTDGADREKGDSRTAPPVIEAVERGLPAPGSRIPARRLQSRVRVACARDFLCARGILAEDVDAKLTY